MSPMPYASEKRRALTAIFIVFLFIFSEILVAENDVHNQLGDENKVEYSLYQYPSNAETFISLQDPDVNFNSANDNLIGVDSLLGTETRGLYRFINNLTAASDSIISAELTLTCEVATEALPGTPPVLYPATIIANFAPLEVTWNEIADSINWQSPGVEGSSDRTVWDTPSAVTQLSGSIHEYSLNVTKLAQTSLDLGRNKFDFVISAIGGELRCFKSGNGNSAYDPVLSITHATGAHGDGGSVTVDFLENGQPLMTGGLITQPDTHPIISYDSLVGSDVEFQFSLADDFRSVLSDNWLYSTMSYPFTTTGSSGEYDIPASEAFNIGDSIFYRYRSVDLTAKLSDWESGYFLLPGYTVTNNNDGTATLNISNDDFNLDGFKLIEDTYVASSSPNQQSSSGVMIIENAPTSQSVIHLGVNLHLLGLQSDITVLDANVELTRISFQSNPVTLSMHEYTGTAWIEDEATWNYGSIGNTWSNAGMDTIGSAEDTGINSNQASDTFAISVHDSAQQFIAASGDSRIDYLLTGMLPGEQPPSQARGVLFFDGTHPNTLNWPTLNLTYSLPVNTSIAESTLLEPIGGQTTWNVTGGNLSGNTTPVMTWETSDNSQQHSILQLATDPFYRNLIHVEDSRTNGNPPTNSDGYAILGTSALSTGSEYFWRVKHIDNDGLSGVWNETSFFVTSMTSQWLGGSLHKLVVTADSEPTISGTPDFAHATISSSSPTGNTFGYPYIGVTDSQSSGKSNGLLGFDIRNYLLPDGLAVVGSEITLTSTSVTGTNPDLGVWELSVHDWNPQEVTWLESSAGVSWGNPGASGSNDRANLLDSVVLTSTGDHTWNITSAVQDSMRDSERLDLMFEVMPGQNNINTLFGSPYSSSNQQPSIEITYALGSNQKPLPPTASFPANAEWVFVNNSSLETEAGPSFHWTPNNVVPISGWGLEIDTTEQFNSPDKRSVSSWNDPGFDVANNIYQLQSDLEIGKQWFWRVRGLSSTYQLGEWSSNFHFYLPDFNVDLVDSTTYTTEFYHNSAISNSNVLEFVDTAILDANVPSSINLNEPFLEVGTTATGLNSSMLLKIPIPIEMHPENATVIAASLALEATPLSTSGIPIAVRNVLQPWNESVNSVQYNDTSNWSEFGGRGIGSDVSAPLDIQESVSGEMSWDITPLVQYAFDQGQTYISVMLYAPASQLGELVYFHSSDYSSEQPTVNFTWSYGNRDLPSSTAVLTTPAPGQIYFNQTSHAIIPDLRPTFTWQWPATAAVNPDAWIVAFDLDPNDDMAGQLVFDSRTDSALFDLVNLEFTPDADIDFRNDIYWSVQAVNNSMYGPISQDSSYFIPNTVGAELSPTDAIISIQDGTIFSPTNFPSATTDTYLDEGAPTTAQDTNGLMIGNSSIANTNVSSTTAIVSFNISMLDMPSTYEILSADLTLTAVSGSGSVEISASRMFTAWDETATWDNNTAGSQWNETGALRGSDSDLPDSLVTVSATGEHTWNVTRIMQLSHAAGSQEVSILLQPEIFNSPTGVVDGNYIFADSENVTLEIRPKLTLEYRTVEQWLAPSPSLVHPANSATLWNTSSYELVGPDSIEFDFNTPLSNVTNWHICHGQELRWLDCESSSSADSEFAFDSATNTFLLDDSGVVNDNFGDQWQYWRIRGDQDHRVGIYSPIFQYRMSDAQAEDDGFGNYTVELSRNSIFQSTGDLPQVVDATTDSVNQQDNYGSDSTLTLGYSSATGGMSQAYFSYDLSDIYFDSLATPISALLELDLASSTQNIAPIDVSVFACDTFDEALITFANSPACSNSEITRATISSFSGSTIQWDITDLLQTNFYTNNDSISFTLAPAAGVTNSVDFYSSESGIFDRPVLRLTYIENIGGLTPPSQTVLSSPANGEVIYDTSSEIVQSPQSVQLNWVQSSDATDYILYIKNQNNINTYDSRFDAAISGNTFTSSQFQPGEVYEWWVQGVNQTIPGPASQRWSFGIGNPDHSYNDDGTYVYTVRDSADVAGYSHMDILDNTITDALPLANFGFSEDLSVGKGCYNTVGSVCDTIISLDMSQIPLSSDQTIHSIELTFSVDQWDFSGGAYAIDLSVHQFLISNWNELGITWNTTGATPGPVAGVDYISTPLDQGTFYGTNSKIAFQIATDSLVLTDNILLIIRGNPLSSSNYDGFVKLHSSDDSQLNMRPSFRVFHTNISSLNITSTASSYNADDSYSFSVQGIDYNGNTVAGGLPSGASIEWSTTTGTIAGTGATTAELTPTVNGLQTITACYGVICTDYVIDLESGLPVELFASLNQNSDVNSVTITADETVPVYAYAVDQHDNLVTNEIISFVPSNGSIDSAGLFSPYTAGQQTITAEWIGAASTLQEVLTVEVLPGVPVEVVLSGCTEIVTADTSCDLFGSAFDQFDNVVWFDDVVGYTLSATDGETIEIITPTPHNVPPSQEVLVGEYTGNFVGQWTITLDTDLGISDSITVDVTHGALDSFTLTSSSPTITADELLFINATRIDVRGNQLPVTLPIENWTNVADGSITPGSTATWTPNSQGTKTITASYQGLSTSVEVFVVRGVIYDLQLIIEDDVSNDGVFSITADDSITASIKALDIKGNQWLVDGEWSYFHPDFADESVLSSNFSQEITFSPILASNTPYTISVDHQEGDVVKSANFVVYVSVGDIENFYVSAIESNGVSYEDVDEFDITADDFVEFGVSTSDTDLNTIDNPQVTWLIEDKSTGSIEEITGYMQQNGLIWHAVDVGEYEITAYLVNNRGFNLSSEFIIVVGHGVPVSLALQQSVTTQDAGNFVDLQVTGTDSDGNQFPQQVVWFENNGPAYNTNSTDTEGLYQFNGRSAGNYTLTAEYLTLSSSVNVEVYSLNIVKNIKSNISTLELEQLETITVQIEAYDDYWNRIAVPDSARIDTTDRGDVKYLGNGVWKLETLDEGEHSATVVIGSITETFTYEVEGNLAGFFAAGGPLYYVAAGLIALILIALLVFVVRLIRGDEEYYDEDEDEDFYNDEGETTPVARDFSQPRVSQAPTVPTPPPTPPSQEAEPEPEEEEEDTSWMADYRVEEDGTEWGQTEDGIWYYREAGSADWIEWTE